MIKIFFRFIYNINTPFSVILFVLAFFIGKNIEGPSYVGCADGWNSPSIGRMGACSHHGGVVRKTTGFISFFIALALGFGANSLVGSLFKEKYGYIVRSNLADHDLQKEIDSRKSLPVYTKITHFKEARKSWSCRICKTIIKPNEKYGWKYAKRDSREKELKFCMPCTAKQNQEIDENIAKNKENYDLFLNQLKTIELYYQNNSIKKKY